MADLDLNTMSLNELRQLLKDVDRAIDQYDSRRKAEARTRVEQIAKDFGFSLGELVQAAQEKSVSIPRYRHPENPELTWSGRGRKPRWIIEALNSGQSLDKFTI
ncbi:H-NS histone family protein [Paracoccus kondratievae]|uniref:Trans-acting regulatory protein hvrA n=1 Tax=Paracoccus kondratievae TaxID=135740 RepID=A0AAD3RSD6_9RHOB|nr:MULTISPECIES: H-NS histone family protein [Paracoccus]QFQ89384.1 H-NS histone family protein [Paracoccus kondratievae]GLK63298.1 trans-acting regulatory protein hvrA [Paracoccus kondratievae]SMG16743.1 DNA-binding protein H-NS [Paracoccus sp. J56]